MPSLIHTHTYRKRRSNPKIFECAHPDCSHYVPKVIIRGKRSLCYCGEPFILESRHLKLSSPVCWKCSNSKEDIARRNSTHEAVKAIENLFEIEIPKLDLLATLEKEEEKENATNN